MNAEPDMEKVQALAGKVIGDVAGAMGVFMAYLGDQAGVYAAIEEAGPVTIEKLAKRTALNPKYLREWLGANAAAGYVTYDPAKETFSLSPEQAIVFAREGHPACMQGFFEALMAQMGTHPQAAATFKSGEGRPWSDHSKQCFCGTDRFFRPGYAANLITGWIPALKGVEERLKAGAKIANIGCGHGSSSILMAQAFPKSTVYGFDFHESSIKAARKKAKKAGVENVEFEVAKAQDFPGKNYDLACIFDALHDMGDPVGAARHIRKTLKPDGTFMLVEPMAGDALKDNLNPVGQVFYAFSTVICTPASLAQEGAMGLGAQAGQKRLTSVLKEAGFTKVRRAAETPTNMVLEVRV